MFSSISMSLDKVSAKTFWILGMYSNVMFCDSSSTAQLFTLEFRVFFSRNFLEWEVITFHCYFGCVYVETEFCVYVETEFFH